ncbi:MAG: HEAT repeat domain-containing protein [Chloroflexota bacterium]
MSIYISYHALDYDFAYELLVYMRNLGHIVTLCIPDASENMGQTISSDSKIVVILRPEYLKSSDYSFIAGLIDKIPSIIPILRSPISIDEWFSDVVFRPIADFTSSNQDLLEENLRLLQNVLIESNENPSPPTPRQICLSNLDLRLQVYNHPLALLEYVNYKCDPTIDIPTSQFLHKTRFKIKTTNKQFASQKTHSANRTDYLENIAQYYKSFVIVCDEIDSSVMIHHMVKMACRQAQVDITAPIPVFLDIMSWPVDVPWIAWLINHTSFSDTPLEDIAAGKYSIYVYGLDHVHFKNHPLKDSFDAWLFGTSPPRFLIITCDNLGKLDDYLVSDVIITPPERYTIQLLQTCRDYADRPFAQYMVNAIENNVSIGAHPFLLQNPMLTCVLLSVKFDDDIDFSRLDIEDLIQSLLNNLWQLGSQRSHDIQGDFAVLEDSLTKIAALATEQQKDLTQVDIEQIFSKTEILMCVDAAVFTHNNNVVRFSMSIIQDYFAAKALIKFGIPINLPKLSVDKRLQRIRQRWDGPVVIFGHLANSKDDALKRIAQSDPVLALLCIKSGVSVSPSIYSYVMEQNLNALITLGDFRVDFAKHLYYIDPKTAKDIFIEVLRDAYWPIRLNAFAAFTELETSILPGLAEAIAGITNATRDHILPAVRRLGTNALSTLFALLRSDSAQMRSNAVWVLGELQDKASVPALIERLQDNDTAVSKLVIMSLDLLQDVNCVPYLIQYLMTHNAGMKKLICTTLIHLLTNMPQDFISLIQNLKVADKLLVIRSLHYFSDNHVVDLFLTLTHDENVDVRLAAIKELGMYPEKRVISRLEDCLDDMTKSRLSKSTVSEMVSKVLANIQKTEPLPVTQQNNVRIDNTNSKSLRSSDIVKARLLQVKEPRLKEKDSIEENSDKISVLTTVSQATNEPIRVVADDKYVTAILEQLRERTWVSSNNAARTLREYVKSLHGTASLNVINQILETLNDADWMIRWTGVEALGWTGNVHVVPHLVQRLTDKNWKVRIAAIRSLSEIGDRNAVKGLSELLSDSNSVVREAAAEALGLLDGPEALQALKSAVMDQEEFVRLAAVESLGKMQQKAAASMLLSALKDNSEHVRWAAANGLSVSVSSDMVSALIPSLSDTAGPYWEQKRICDVIVDILRQIGSDEALNAIASRGSSHV